MESTNLFQNYNYIYKVEQLDSQLNHLGKNPGSVEQNGIIAIFDMGPGFCTSLLHDTG